MKVLLVQPPRPLWPYINEQDNYILPQWLVCLAAALRAEGIEVHALDCMPVRMGWASLANTIRALRPDVVASGENHALFSSTVVRLMRLVKAIDPDIATIVGGGHFTNTVDLYLPAEPIDYIVRGEGETTLVDLVRAIEGSGIAGGRTVPGVAWHDGEAVRVNPPRPLIEDLDSLPLPAYDMLPLRLYGTARYLFSPGGATIHHSRGCTGACRFCAWWRQMSERRVREGDDCRAERLVPRWRTKSVDRTLEEMEILYRRYDKRCLVFVDPTFNIDPEWNDEFATKLIRKDWDLTWFAFMRAELILRDEKLGIFEKLVRSGLVHTCIGVERAKGDPALRRWRKPGTGGDDYERCFDLLHDRYPQVYRQASFIIGTADESWESARRQLAHARRLRADFPAFHPVTPFPGTDLYDEALADGSLEITDFDAFDMMTAVMGTKHMTREEVEQALIELNKAYVGPLFIAKGLLSPHRYRRDMVKWFLSVSARVFVASVKKRVNPFSPDPYTSAYTPSWYET